VSLCALHNPNTTLNSQLSRSWWLFSSWKWIKKWVGLRQRVAKGMCLRNLIMCSRWWTGGDCETRPLGRVSYCTSRFAKNEFCIEFKSTIGVEFQTRTITIKDKVIKVQLRYSSSRLMGLIQRCWFWVLFVSWFEKWFWCISVVAWIVDVYWFKIWNLFEKSQTWKL
jgi:hypothetical protein